MKLLQTRSSSNRRSQRGVTLIEALVALVVMSFGMVALVGLMGNLRRSGDLAKQRSEAMRLAQDELAKLRSFSVLTKPSGAAANIKDYDNDIVSPDQPFSITPDNGNTTFLVTRAVAPLVKDSAEPQGKTVRVTVSWQDRTSAPQSVFLDTVISRTDPVYAVALGVTPPNNGVRQPDSRNPVVPPAAKDLGNGSSAFRPGSGSMTVWVFNNVTGVITGKCEIPIGTAVTTLTASIVESCNNPTTGYLVSGTIRFSSLAAPDPSSPEADALPQPLSVYLSLTPSQFKNKAGTALEPGGDYPSPDQECYSDAPALSTPSQKLVNYHCIVYPNSQTPRNWWGQVLLSGLDLGTGATQYKVCRYSGDYNGNGYTYATITAAPGFKIDNEEHPEIYRGVSYSLARQNFLVMPGKTSAACPLLPADVSVSRFVDYSTYQIQP
jgi:type II secretory pathway pseudopilin PulG